MANMYPKNIDEYLPKDSERIVYQELKNQLPDSFDVFYSVNWTSFENGIRKKSEADFIVTSPDYGFLCLEVKGGTGIRVDNNEWYLSDTIHGERHLTMSPYRQAEKNMYFFKQSYSSKYHMEYQGFYGAAVVFPFFPVEQHLNLDNRNRLCTIDCNDLNNLFDRIKRIFKMWAGNRFGRQLYQQSQHEAFLQLIRSKLAISAAAGSLVKFKDMQLSVINRVQDNYLYFIQNVNQYYIRGGAGTGKTWIAMKAALQEVQHSGRDVLFVCSSKNLSTCIRSIIGGKVSVYSIEELFNLCIDHFPQFIPPLYQGISGHIKKEALRYDAIFVDEAQDFTEEWALVIRQLLKDNDNSKLGIFYDDVQVFRENSFGDGFGIESKPFLLHENIRNTANIYKWTAEKTNLGTDMVANPVEGPSPVTEYIREKGQLTLRLENLFREYFEKEYLPYSSLTILVDNIENFLSTYSEGIAKWKFHHGSCDTDGTVSVFSVEEFKGLESDMVIYIHDKDSSLNMDYIAYTRAKYYLIELVREY